MAAAATAAAEEGMEPRALQYEQTLVREAEQILEEYAPGPLLLVTPGVRELGAYPYPSPAF